MADDPTKPPEPPQGVPQHAHPQVTQPFGIPAQTAQPWAFPHYQQPSPVVDLKKTSWHDVVKTAIVVLGALGTVAGYLYSAGIQAGETRSFKETVSARLAQQDARESVRADDLRSTKTAVIDLANQVREMNDKLRRLNVTGRNRPRRADRSDASDE